MIATVKMKCELIASLLLLPGLSFGVAIDKRAQTKVPGLTWYAGQLAPAPVAESAVDLTVKPDGGNKSSPLLWGMMFEDINHSGDGGIHGQLLMNNGFQGDNPGLTAWKGVNGAKISQDRKTPLTKAITSTLKIEVPSSSDDEDLVGAANTGYNGMPVAEQRYNNYFWVRGSYKGPVTIRLVGSTSQVVYASHEVNVDSNDSRFTYYETSFNSTASPDGDNEWQFLINTSKASGKTVHLGLPQLFPPTFKNRENGLRKDVSEFINELHPSFLRFPGGNNLEGTLPGNRWRWNETIGPVEDRPGRQGNWGYANTDALGLHEYLEWCEDMNMEPVLAVWAGATIGGPIVPGSELEPYVDDALNELEYILGDQNTTLGRLRAKNGHPQPFSLKHVEIGNEDWLNGCEQYPSRFKHMYEALHEKYPQLTYISSVSRFDPKCYPHPPKDVIEDLHHYLPPDDMVAHFNELDHWDGRILVGEYASTSNNDGSFTRFSTMQGACSEAVFMMGIERNSDRVEMSCFAPFFEHLDMNQWQPNLIVNDNGPNTLTGSVSYYVQKMFSNHAGEEILPVETVADFGPLYWSASKSGKQYIVKLANYGEKRQTVNINLPVVATNASVDLLASDDIMQHGPLLYNSPGQVKIQTRTEALQSKDGRLSLSLAPWAVAVVYT